MTVVRDEIRERARRSFFADCNAPPGAVRVCQGISCVLAAGPSRAEQALAGRPRQDVHCLGYCHRSPAWLEPDGTVRCEAAPEAEVRCHAARPVVTERLGRGSFASLEAARAAGVYGTLERFVDRPPGEILEVLEASGERGRGGAGFPTGRKWRLCSETPDPERFVVANGDEGDPGSFVDRLLMERDPHAVLEGMALCARAVGARRGVIYVRSEYPEARARLERAVDEARAVGLLGSRVLGRDFSFDIEVAAGMGSYVSGEETALLESLEGRRGEVRPRPPYPVEAGLNGHPTVVNNVETLVNVPWILREGADAYRRLGTELSPGTKALCLNAGFGRPGVLEIGFGANLREVIEEWGGGGRGGAALAGVVLGGPMGSVLLPEEWDIALDPELLQARDIQLGHGGLVALPVGVDWRALLHHWLEFMVRESCGKCVPCRLGSQRALELAQSGSAESLDALRDLLDLVRDTSLCGFGQLMPVAVRRLLDLSPDDPAGPR
jgi:NADH:ubiquinone oxidoreductase subunit F (NADH-binding)